MIFQERAKKNYDVEFHIGKHTNDVVHEYTYLEKALHALISL